MAHLRQIVTLDQKMVVAQFARNLPETAPLQVAQFVQNHWLTLVQNGWLTLVQIIQIRLCICSRAQFSEISGKEFLANLPGIKFKCSNLSKASSNKPDCSTSCLKIFVLTAIERKISIGIAYTKRLSEQTLAVCAAAKP